MDPQVLEAIKNTITVCTLITVIFSVINVFSAVSAHLKEPDVKQNQKISSLEERMTKVEAKLAADEERLEKADEGTKAMMESLLALLDNAIDSNSSDTATSLNKAKKRLETFLINK